MKPIQLCLVSAGLVFCALASHAQAPAGTHAASSIASALEPQRIELTERWSGGPVYASAVRGNYAYFGSGGTLRVLEMVYGASDRPPEWRPVTSIEAAGVVRDIEFSGDHLIVADDGGALRSFDISDPERPVPSGVVPLPEFVRAVSVIGEFALVAIGWDGIGVVDINDPSNPVEIARVRDIGYIVDVHARDGIALAADTKGFVHVL
ncbi:MAG: hypothetical protein R3233_04735, partial [Xanthomonadales bacterium]|nr:hypothetical protein [Xanthomonadales bacterium]